MPPKDAKKSERPPPSDESDIASALEEFWASEDPCKAEIARRHRIGIGVLNSRINGHLSHREGAEHLQKLPESAERGLVSYFQWRSRLGYAINLKEAEIVAEGVAEKHDVPLDEDSQRRLGESWFTRFRKRHPDLILNNDLSIDEARLLSLTPERHAFFFDTLEDLVARRGYQASNVFAMDETNLFLNKVTSKMGTLHQRPPKGQKVPRQTAGKENRETVTAAECICADGTDIPPMIIFKGQGRVTADWKEGGPPGTFWKANPKSYNNLGLMLEWIRDHFHPLTVEKQTAEGWRLLLLDNASVHFNYHIFCLCEELQIDIVTYPAHSTDLLQPHDVLLFSPLKMAFNAEHHKLLVEGEEPAKGNFSRRYAAARTRAVTEHNILTSFDDAGIWPVNRLRTNKARLEQAAIAAGAIAKDSDAELDTGDPFATPFIVRRLTGALRGEQHADTRKLLEGMARQNQKLHATNEGLSLRLHRVELELQRHKKERQLKRKAPHPGGLQTAPENKEALRLKEVGRLDKLAKKAAKDAANLQKEAAEAAIQARREQEEEASGESSGCEPAARAACHPNPPHRPMPRHSMPPPPLGLSGPLTAVGYPPQPQASDRLPSLREIGLYGPPQPNHVMPNTSFAPPWPSPYPTHRGPFLR